MTFTTVQGLGSNNVLNAVILRTKKDAQEIFVTTTKGLSTVLLNVNTEEMLYCTNVRDEKRLCDFSNIEKIKVREGTEVIEIDLCLLKDICIFNHMIYMAVAGKGLIVVDWLEYTKSYVASKYDEDTGLGSNDVNSICISNDGTIYAGTSGGLSISSDGGETFINKTTKDGLVGNDVKSVDVFDNGTICVGTSEGLSISRDGGKTFINKTTEDGLGSNNINNVRASEMNMIFVATDMGLSVSLNEGENFDNITTKDGLKSDEVNSGYIFGDDKLWVATKAGLTVLKWWNEKKEKNSDRRYFFKVRDLQFPI